MHISLNTVEPFQNILKLYLIYTVLNAVDCMHTIISRKIKTNKVYCRGQLGTLATDYKY